MTQAAGAGDTGSAADEPLCDEARDVLATARAAARERGPGAPDDDEDHRYLVALLRRALASGEPSAPDLLASVHLDRGHRLLAAEVLTAAVRRDRRDDLAGLLGETLAEVGDHEGAESAFLIGLDAADPGAQNGYGVFLWGRGRTQEASYVLDLAARGGDDLAPLNLVALYLDELSDPITAEVLARRFHDEGRPSTLVALADVRLAQGRIDDAEALYRRAVELGAVCGHVYLGWFLQDRRADPDGAEEQLRLAHAAGEPRAAFHLGRFLFDAGRPEDAAPCFEEAAHHGDIEAADVIEAEYGRGFDRWDD